MPTTTSATGSSEEPLPRTASESGGITTSVRLWALPMNASPKPRRSGATSRATSDSAAGNVRAIPIPWLTRATTNGSRSPAGIDSRQEEHAGADEVRDGADGEKPQPTEAVDQRSAGERRWDLDDRRQSDDHADFLVGHARPGRGRPAARR